MLRTNADLSPLETMLCYKHLWMVERAFRTSKSLFARPISISSTSHSRPCVV